MSPGAERGVGRACAGGGTTRAGIALGSNRGDRLENLRGAARALGACVGVRPPILRSGVYETEPVGCAPGDPPFLNAVMEIGWEGCARDLFAALMGIERGLGRERGGGRNAPRAIDLDLLYFGEETLREADLSVPHPAIGGRRFVLVPLAEIRPGLRLPGMPGTVSELLGAMGDEGPWVRALCGGGWIG